MSQGTPIAIRRDHAHGWDVVVSEWPDGTYSFIARDPESQMGAIVEHGFRNVDHAQAAGFEWAFDHYPSTSDMDNDQLCDLSGIKYGRNLKAFYANQYGEDHPYAK